MFDFVGIHQVIELDEWTKPLRDFEGYQPVPATMKMDWTPQEDGLREILSLLRESQSPDTATQRAVQQVSFEIEVCITSLPYDLHSHNNFEVSCSYKCWINLYLILKYCCKMIFFTKKLFITWFGEVWFDICLSSLHF